MNKQELSILSEIQKIIEERNALKADKEALIDALRHCLTACDHCDHNYTRPCCTAQGHDIDCTTCTDACTCRDCKAGSCFKWVGRVELGKHVTPEHELPVGIRRSMEERKNTKAR